MPDGRHALTGGISNRHFRRRFSGIQHEYARVSLQAPIQLRLYHRALSRRDDLVLGKLERSYLGNSSPWYWRPRVVGVGVPPPNAAYRMVVFGGPPNADPMIRNLAGAAGELIGVTGMFKSLLGDWKFYDDESRWWALLFEVALTGRSPLIVARKYLQLRAEDGAELCFEHGFASSVVGWERIGAEVVSPDSWISDIPNAAKASTDLCDIVLDEASTSEGRPPNGYQQSKNGGPIASESWWEAIPPLDVKSGDWVQSRRAASILSMKTASLSKARKRGANHNDVVGRDSVGRIWRIEEGKKPSRYWYLLESLANATRAATQFPAQRSG